MRLLVANIMEMAFAEAPIGAESIKGADGSFRVFRDLPISDEGGSLPIREILFGPKADYERSRIHLMTELETRGYSKCMPRIVKSAGSLR